MGGGQKSICDDRNSAISRKWVTDSGDLAFVLAFDIELLFQWPADKTVVPFYAVNRSSRAVKQIESNAG